MTENAQKYIWSNLNMAEIVPGVNPPLVTDTLIDLLTPAARELFYLSNFTPVIKEIKGRLYLNLTVFEEVLKKIIRTENFSVTDFFGGAQAVKKSIPAISIRAKIDILIFGFKIILNSFYSLRRLKKAIAPLKERAELLINRVAVTNKLSELIDLGNEILSYIVELFSVGFKGLLYPFTSYFLFVSICQKWLNDKTNKKAHILLATGGGELQCVEAFSDLWEISRQIKGNSFLAEEFIKTNSVLQAEKLMQKSPKLYAKYQVFLKEHGYRCVKEIDFSLPRWSEDPSFIISMIKNYLSASGDNSPRIKQKIIKEKQASFLKQVSKELPFWKFFILKKFLNLSRKAQYDREHTKSEFVRILVPLHFLFLKIGERLFEQGFLKTPSDVFMMTREEVSSFYSDKRNIDKEEFLTLIEERKQEYQKYPQIKLPDIITDLDEISEISSASLGNKTDPALLHCEGSSSGAIINIHARERTTVLKGIAVSCGKVEGVARVINSIEEISKLKPGNILVTDHTDPGWTPVFATVKGIITNTGGLLSHASITAREFGLPAVVNVANATSIIKDGENILLDGDKGTIKIIK